MAKTVMVVDDEADFLGLLDAALTPEGYAVTLCPLPAEAYSKARQVQPDVIVVDLLMPGQRGWQVIEQLKRDPLTAAAHIIVCTAAVLEASYHRDRLQRWGCDVLLKPFELDDLLALLAKARAA